MSKAFCSWHKNSYEIMRYNGEMCTLACGCERDVPEEMTQSQKLQATSAVMMTIFWIGIVLICLTIFIFLLFGTAIAVGG